MIKYYKLLDVLNRRSMTKEELRQQIGISSATMSKISAHKPVSLDVIDKICDALSCQPGDIIEYVAETQATAYKAQSEEPAENVTEPTESATKPSKKQENHCKPFTDADTRLIDLPKLLTNLKYQLDIWETFGKDVLVALMEKAKQQEAQKEAIPNQ